MKQKFQDDLKAAIKSGDTLRTMVLRSVLAEISRYEVETTVRREADENAIVQILKREKARREEALGFAEKAARQDLIDANKKEIAILEEYLPAAVSSDEIRGEIAQLVAKGTNQIGPIMKALREKFGSRLDSRTASELVKQELTRK